LSDNQGFEIEVAPKEHRRTLIVLGTRKRNEMKKFLVMAILSVAALTMPASAQVYFDTDIGEASRGNRLDDPNYGWPHSHWRRGYDAYARGECRVVREQIVMPDGRVIYRSREICG
jgi:hypothetical protein